MDEDEDDNDGTGTGATPCVSRGLSGKSTSTGVEERTVEDGTVVSNADGG